MTYLMILLFSVLDVEKEDSVDYIIANFLLSNIQRLSGLSLSDIASECQVSKASISRFCKRIGLLDYVDLQILIRNNDVNLRDTKNKREYKEKEEIQDYFEKLHHQESFIKEIVLQSETNSLIQDILTYDSIACFGHLQSGNAAHELRHNLSRVQKMVYCSSSLASQQKYIQNATSSDLIIVFSATGRFFQRLFVGKDRLPLNKLPRIYMITTQPVKMELPYIYKIIELNQEYDDLISHIAIGIYVNYLSYIIQQSFQ